MTDATTKKRLPMVSTIRRSPPLVALVVGLLLVTALLGDPSVPPWTLEGAELLPEPAAAELYWSRV